MISRFRVNALQNAMAREWRPGALHLSMERDLPCAVPC